MPLNPFIGSLLTCALLATQGGVAAQSVVHVDAFRDAIVVTWAAETGTGGLEAARSFHVATPSDLMVFPESGTEGFDALRMRVKDWWPEGGEALWTAWQREREEARLALELKRAQGDLVEEDLAVIRANRKVGGTSEALLVEDLEAVADWMHEETKDLLYRRVELMAEIAAKQAEYDEVEARRGLFAARKVHAWSSGEAGGRVDTRVVERAAGQGWRPVDLLSLDSSGDAPRLTWFRRAELMLDLPVTRAAVPVRFHDAVHAGLAERPDARPQELGEYDVKREGLTVARDDAGRRSSAWPGTSWLAESVEVGPGVHVVVPLGSLDVPVAVRHHAVPRQSPVVNMRLAISRPGAPVADMERAGFVIDGRPAGEVWLTPRGDSLIVDAGATHDWTVERTREAALCGKSTLGNRIKHHRAYRITVTNRSARAGEIVIEEPLPISRNAEIEVLPESIDGGILDQASGIVEWRLALAAGESRTLQFSYDLSHGRDQPVPDFD